MTVVPPCASLSARAHLDPGMVLPCEFLHGHPFPTMVPWHLYSSCSSQETKPQPKLRWLSHLQQPPAISPAALSSDLPLPPPCASTWRALPTHRDRGRAAGCQVNPCQLPGEICGCRAGHGHMACGCRQLGSQGTACSGLWAKWPLHTLRALWEENSPKDMRAGALGSTSGMLMAVALQRVPHTSPQGMAKGRRAIKYLFSNPAFIKRQSLQMGWAESKPQVFSKTSPFQSWVRARPILSCC